MWPKWLRDAEGTCETGRDPGAAEGLRDCPTPESSTAGKPSEPGPTPGSTGRPPHAPPPSAPAFPDDIHACFRSQEAPFFMLPAFLPRSPSVSTESPRPRERRRRRVPDARARQPPGESCAHAQWPASHSRGLTRKCLCLRERRSGPRLAGALRRWRWAVRMQRLLLPSLRALTGSRNVGLLVPRVASRTQVPTPAGSGHGSRAGIKKARIK